MSYDLTPRNKKIEEISVGAFSWPIFLQETGMGYVLGYGANKNPGSYVYQNGANGSPVSNDGYKVNSFQAKAMAAVAKGFVSVQRFVNKEWENHPGTDEEKEILKKSHFDGARTYRGTWHEDRLIQLEKIAEFMENSRGFSIN